MYFIGIFVFSKARHELGKKIFINKFEISMCVIVVATAAISGLLWWKGMLVLD